MVRQFEETRRSRLMVLLDLDPGAYADDAEFELAVSAAASVGATGDPRRAHRVVRRVRARRGHGGAVRGSAMRELPTVSRDRLLDALCVVERDDQAVMLPDVARAAAEGAARRLARLPRHRHGARRRRRCARRRRGSRSAIEAIAVQCAPEGEAAARTVAGLTVFGIGYLEDLRAMLARSASVA